MWIVDDRYMFLHLPKAGGTYVRTALENCGGHKVKRVRNVYKHFGLRVVPEQHRHLLPFGTIRNPYDYYVSFWRWQKKNKKLPIDQLDPKEFHKFVKYVMGDRPLEDRRHGGPPTNLKIGLLTYQHIDLYSPNPFEVLEGNELCQEQLDTPVNVIKLGDVSLFLCKVFGLTGTGLESGNWNATHHLPPTNYYDGETARLVEERDKYIFERYGYEPGLSDQKETQD